MRLLYIDPTTTDALDAHIRGILDAHKSVNTAIEMDRLPLLEGESPTPFLPPIPDFYDRLFGLVKDGEVADYDGILVGCAADPGLREMDYMTDVPVFAPLRSALHIAGLLGRKTAVLCPSHDEEQRSALSWHEDSIRRYAIPLDTIVFRTVKVGRPDQSLVESYIRDGSWDQLKDEVLSPFQRSVCDDGLTQARLAIQEDRAEVVFFACTLWGGMLSPLAAQLPVPVLDPIITMLKAAEAAIHSRIT